MIQWQQHIPVQLPYLTCTLTHLSFFSITPYLSLRGIIQTLLRLSAAGRLRCCGLASRLAFIALVINVARRPSQYYSHPLTDQLPTIDRLARLPLQLVMPSMMHRMDIATPRADVGDGPVAYETHIRLKLLPITKQICSRA